MNTEIETALADALGGIAPEADLSTVDRSAILREELDLDSMDLLAVYTALSEKLGVEIPESDYPALATLDGLVTTLARKLAAR
ncbi:MAG: acyl carrier protein [Alphaproteobacteria bacterium]|nr:acyl carrier protein [Alphaproteobacteria bacterium]